MWCSTLLHSSHSFIAITLLLLRIKARCELVHSGASCKLTYESKNLPIGLGESNGYLN